MHLHLPIDVANWIKRQIGRNSKIVEDCVREAGMGISYKKRRLEAIIAADGPGSLAAMAELEEIEKYKNTAEYKLRFLEDQKRVIRNYKLNGGFVSNIARESVMNNLDMDKIEVIEFINNTILDFEKGYISILDLDLEIERLRLQRTEEPDELIHEEFVNDGEKVISDYTINP